MANNVQAKLERPKKLPEQSVPPLPVVDDSKSDVASTTYSRYRTRLSGRRTGLSEHRTRLSEYRTDLSGERTDMSMQRTGLSFQRTRMSADRTLMSVLRTSLSLIGFGFTIFQFFQKLRDVGVLAHAAAPRNFAIALVSLGILMLVVGIIYHLQFMYGLRELRSEMASGGRIYGESKFPPSLTLIIAVVLLLIGVFAVSSMVYQAGPFR